MRVHMPYMLFLLAMSPLMSNLRNYGGLDSNLVCLLRGKLVHWEKFRLFPLNGCRKFVWKIQGINSV